MTTIPAAECSSSPPAGPAPASAPRLRGLRAIVPGLALTAAIAATAFALRLVPGIGVVSPMILAMLIGITLHNLAGTPALAKPGIKFSVRRVLRFAIILLGLQLSVAQLIAVGGRGLGIIAASLLATFAVTTWIGHRLGVDRKLTQLIAAGSSICGASAVIATNAVTDAPDEDVAYAVACVTVFGSVAMFGYPLLPALLALDPQSYGLWAGASIHEIAQVVAAGFQDGAQAGEFATIAKLARVAMLAPLVIALGAWAARSARRNGGDRQAARPPLPWFVLGFVALVGVNSVIAIPAEAKAWIVVVTTFLLTLALAAMGLETDLRKLAAKGIRPALVGALAFLFIASFSLALIKLTG